MIHPTHTSAASYAGDDFIGRLDSCGSGVAQRQWRRLEERKATPFRHAIVKGTPFAIFRGVYDTGGDTALFVDTVTIAPGERFLEVGCGAGVIAVHLASRGGTGIGLDINPAAIANARQNARLYGIAQLEFREADVFGDVTARFHVVVCNPPYSSRAVRDEVDRMFWDPKNKMKTAFFRGVCDRLLPGGRVYFGWADFPDLDPRLPSRLAARVGLTLRETHRRRVQSGDYEYQVLVFQRNYDSSNGWCSQRFEKAERTGGLKQVSHNV